MGFVKIYGGFEEFVYKFMVFPEKYVNLPIIFYNFNWII